MAAEPTAPESEAPSTLDLVRLSPRLLFPPGGRELYRQVALLAGLSEGDEVLVAGSGNGVTLEYFVREYGVQGSGVDVDEAMVAATGDRVRGLDLGDRMQLQHASLDRLPYRDEIFDVAVGELGLTAHADPEAAVRELVRVTRPTGTVVLLQLVWKAPVDEARRRVLTSYLGVRPLMLVEWKRLLREAGLEKLHTEDWSDEETAFRPRIAKPFPDFAELFSIGEKIGIFRRAWRRWGWSGLRTAVAREREVHRLLTRERILGLDLVKGVKPAVSDELRERDGSAAVVGSPSDGHENASAVSEPNEPPPRLDEAASSEEPGRHFGERSALDGSDTPENEGSPDPATEGLPLFGGPDDET